MSEVRVVDLMKLGVSKEVFDKIYSMGEQDGRADAIDECIQSIKDNWYFWNIGVIAEVIKKLEQLKEQNNERDN